MCDHYNVIIRYFPGTKRLFIIKNLRYENDHIVIDVSKEVEKIIATLEAQYEKN